MASTADDSTAAPSALRASRPSPSPPSALEAPESFLARYLTTPLFFASFLVSFLLVDTRNHRRTGSSDRDAARPAEPWFWRAKHRKLARLEIGQALERRRLVLVGLLVVLGVGCLGTWWVVRWALGSAVRMVRGR
ncbi:hypothetical protein MMC18_006581 [Xylographa bjoerkii]|nr:hypothetical protein [Xylographa bjoerkii]